MYRNNGQVISKAVEKMKNNQLLIEDVLDEEDLVNDLKSPSFSQLISFLNTERMIQLLDYMLKEPPKDSDQKIGHKFPYFACEILCSENVFLLEKYFEDTNKHEEEEHQEEEKKEENLDEKEVKNPEDEEVPEDIKPKPDNEGIVYF